jgi:thioredoxin 1
MSHTIDVTDSTFAQEVENSPGITMVDFWAVWCRPCHAVAPILEQIAAERVGAVKVAKLDIDTNMRTAARFNVRSAPTLLFFKEGKVVAQIVGAVPKARIESTLQQLVPALVA